ncbi:MAG: GHKL domain-containing protein [Clostridiales Family XIII bacterium]|jgi:hypothetical protein|nr:GHKL domain-containing protein [Clostridiales Family XIII bacterium]
MSGAFIAERLSEISTIVLHIYFLYRTLDTKTGKDKQILAGTIFLCVRMAYYILGFGYRPYFSLIAGIVYASFVFSGKFKEYMIWAAIPIVFDGIIDAALISLYLLLPNTFAEQIYAPGITHIIILIIARVTLLAVYYFTTRRIDKSNAIKRYDSVLLLAILAGAWITLEIVFRYSDMLTERLSYRLLAASSMALLLIMASVVALYNRINASGKELAQSQLQLRTAEMTQEHINQINDIYAKLSTVRHDLHNHFSAISGYLKTQDYIMLEQYLEKLTDLDMEAQEYINNPVLNTLVSSRMTAAKNANINFIADIMLPENLPLTDFDLCILFGNILDNAFDANKDLDSGFVDLRTRMIDSYWVVACRNSTRKPGQLRTVDSLKSTKDAPGIHGIGTKQIQKIAEKSGGFVSYRHEGHEFTTLVMINISAVQAAI